MAGLLSALVFPYTGVPDPALEKLLSVFGKVFLLQAVGMKPSPRLDQALASGALEIIRPGADRFDESEIRQVLAQTGDWVLNIRNLKEISHLKGMLIQNAEESSPLALATAIRRHGQDHEDKGFMDHLMLHLAAWHDERQREADQAVAKLESAERSLRESLGGGPDREDEALYPSLDPLAPKGAEADPLSGLRIEAWSKLFAQAPVKADLWVTGPGAFVHLAEKYEERTGMEPLRLGSLGRDKAGEILAKTGLEELQDRRFGFLELIRLGSVDLPGLLGTGEKQTGTETIVGVMEF